jgi:hypothetical protein
MSWIGGTGTGGRWTRWREHLGDAEISLRRGREEVVDGILGDNAATSILAKVCREL